MTLSIVRDAEAHEAAAIAKNALDALTVVEAARMFGLPIPFDVSFTAYAVRAQVHTYDELVTWVERLGVDITKRPMSDGRAHYVANGVIAGATVTVSAIDRMEADQ